MKPLRFCLLCLLCGPLWIILYVPYYILCFPIIWSCRRYRRPRAKSMKPKVTRFVKKRSENKCWFQFCACLYHRCCCSLKFMLTASKAIKRYEEQPPMSFDQFYRNLQENWKINIILTSLNSRLSKFFFKILPSGSTRERFGKILPSRSVLASDFDLMLVPDAVKVRDATGDDVSIPMQNGNQNYFPATFEAIDDPNSNPESPHGFLWLRLLEKELKHWDDLCYQRLTTQGVEQYLSQLAVYEMVKMTILNDPTVKTLFELYGEINVKVEVERNGPALTVLFSEIKEKKVFLGLAPNEITETEIFHVDFTLAIHCEKFPRNAQGFFQKRDLEYGYSNQHHQIHWPPQEVVDKIQKIGCHVVPKPSSSELVFYTPEQKQDSYLSQGAALEWRYSFSQAEIILSDYVPKQARTAFLAFKAVIKMRINNVADMWGNFHEVPSYVMKTILLDQIEIKPPNYWQDGVEEDFLNILLDALIHCVGERVCHMYWIREINLLQDMTDTDIQFILQKLNLIKGKLIKYLTDDWLECQRLMRLNCCRCFNSNPLQKVIHIEANVKKCACCNLSCKSGVNVCCFGPLSTDPVKFDMY